MRGLEQGASNIYIILFVFPFYFQFISNLSFFYYIYYTARLHSERGRGARGPWGEHVGCARGVGRKTIRTTMEGCVAGWLGSRVGKKENHGVG